MAEPAVGADLREPLDVLRPLPAEVALDLAGLDRLAQLHDLVVGQVLDVGVRIDAGVRDDLRRRGLADAVDVGEAHLHALVDRDVDPRDTSHQPCLCLWRGLEQITRTRPRRRMIRQRSHIGFTDARTFTLYSLGRIQSTSEKSRGPHESGPRAQKYGPSANGEW